jgi:hypothetical protein
MSRAHVYQDGAHCGSNTNSPTARAIGQYVPHITSTVICMEHDWGPDGEPGTPETLSDEPQSLPGETAEPIPWRSYLTARIPSGRPGRRMPVWLLLLLVVIAVIAHFAFHVHWHSHCHSFWNKYC